MSTSKGAPKPLRYQLYLQHRYGSADKPYEFHHAAADAWRRTRIAMAEMVERRVTSGHKSIVPEWTAQTVKRGEYEFVIEMESDDYSMEDYCVGWAKQYVVRGRQPQTRDPKVGHCIEGAPNSHEWVVLRIYEDVPQLVAQLRPAWGGPIAHEKAVRIIKGQVQRYREFYRGDLYYVRIKVSCEALDLNEVCGGFESDDEAGQSEWVEDQIQSALNSKHQ